MSLPSSSALSIERIDLSLGSTTIFWSHRNPLLSPSPRKNWLPLSSPVKSHSEHGSQEPQRGYGGGGAPATFSTSEETLPEGGQPGVGSGQAGLGEGSMSMLSLDLTSVPIAGPSKPRAIVATKALEQVEDVTDSQWDQAVLSSAQRRHRKCRDMPLDQELKVDKTDLVPSSPIAGDRSDTPPLSSIRTPPSMLHGHELHDLDDPMYWPDSPPLPTTDDPMLAFRDADSRKLSQNGFGRDASPERLFQASVSPKRHDGHEGGFDLEIAHEHDCPPTISAMTHDSLNCDGKESSARDVLVELAAEAESSTLEADSVESRADPHVELQHASLADLFADDEPSPDPSPPSPPPLLRPFSAYFRSPQKASSTAAAEVMDLTTSDAEEHHDSTNHEDDVTDQNQDNGEYDYDDIPFSYMDFDADLDSAAGPSTTPSRPSHSATELAPEIQSSHTRPPPALHPIVVITDLPPDVQEFYNNHWRRGVDTKRKVSATVMQDWSDQEDRVKTKKRAPMKRGPPAFLRGRWRKRGGRGGARGRGRGKA